MARATAVRFMAGNRTSYGGSARERPGDGRHPSVAGVGWVLGPHVLGVLLPPVVRTVEEVAVDDVGPPAGGAFELVVGLQPRVGAVAAVDVAAAPVLGGQGDALSAREGVHLVAE